MLVIWIFSSHTLHASCTYDGLLGVVLLDDAWTAQGGHANQQQTGGLPEEDAGQSDGHQTAVDVVARY